MTLAGFEPANAGSERPQTYSLDRAATEIGYNIVSVSVCMYCVVWVRNLVAHIEGGTYTEFV